MKIYLVSFTRAGSKLNQTICMRLNEKGHECEGYSDIRYHDEFGLRHMEESLNLWTGNRFHSCDGFIFIGACGIAVRGVAPFVKDKYTDPAVVTVDELGNYVIPLLSGHVGGGNELAHEVALITGGIPIISTATDLNHVFAVDVFAKRNELLITDRILAKEISVELLEGKQITLSSDLPLEGKLPNGISYKDKNENKKIDITIFDKEDRDSNTLRLIPKIVCLGIGCRKGTDACKLEEFVLEELHKLNISIESVVRIVSIDIKKEEFAIKQLSEKHNWDFITYSEEELNKVQGDFKESDFVRSITGVGNVCERAAVLGSSNGQLILQKTVREGMTLAVAISKRRIIIE
jgi:cobalt-precorrin 5A hydrolase